MLSFFNMNIINMAKVKIFIKMIYSLLDKIMEKNGSNSILMKVYNISEAYDKLRQILYLLKLN